MDAGSKRCLMTLTLSYNLPYVSDMEGEGGGGGGGAEIVVPHTRYVSDVERRGAIAVPPARYVCDMGRGGGGVFVSCITVVLR